MTQYEPPKPPPAPPATPQPVVQEVAPVRFGDDRDAFATITDFGPHVLPADVVEVDPDAVPEEEEEEIPDPKGSSVPAPAESSVNVMVMENLSDGNQEQIA